MKRIITAVFAISMAFGQFPEPGGGGGGLVGPAGPPGTGDVNGAASLTAAGRMTYVSMSGAIAETASVFLDAANSRLGVGNVAPATTLQVGGLLGTDGGGMDYTEGSAIIVGKTNSNSAAQPGVPAARETVMTLYRRGANGAVYPAQVDFALKRYAADSGNARTQLDLRLLHEGADEAGKADVMSLRSAGLVGINNTSPAQALDVIGNTKQTGFSQITKISTPAAAASGTLNLFATTGGRLSCIDQSSAECFGEFLQTGTGAVARSMVSKQRETVSVVDFGADPTGAVDSLAAFDAAYLASDQVFIPKGTYTLSGMFVQARGRTTVRCETPGTVIQYTGGGAIAAVVKVGDASVNKYNQTFSGCAIKGNANSATAVWLVHSAHSRLDNLSMYDAATCLLHEWGVSNTITNPECSGNAGMTSFASTTGLRIWESNSVTVVTPTMENLTGTGIEIGGTSSGSHAVTIIGGTSEQNNKGVTIDVGSEAKILNMDNELNAVSDVEDGGSGNVIDGGEHTTLIRYLSTARQSTVQNVHGANQITIDAGANRVTVRNNTVGNFAGTITDNGTCSIIVGNYSATTSAYTTDSNTCGIGGGGASALSGLTDLQVSRGSDTVVNIAAGSCGYFDGPLVDYSAATATISGTSASSTAYIACDPATGALTVSHNGATTITCSGCTTITSATDAPVGSVPLGTVPYTSNVWGSVAHKRSLNRREHYVAGDNISIATDATGEKTISSTSTLTYLTGFHAPWGLLLNTGNPTDVFTANQTRWQRWSNPAPRTITGIGISWAATGIGGGAGLRFAIADGSGTILHTSTVQTTCATNTRCEADMAAPVNIASGDFYIGITTDSTVLQTLQLSPFAFGSVSCAWVEAGTNPKIVGTGTAGAGTGASVAFGASMGALTTRSCDGGSNTYATTWHDIYVY